MLLHVMQGNNASRSKRQRTSRLGGAKKKVDRLNYLFEAIEADKASDSETAHGTDSRGSQGEDSDSARSLRGRTGDMLGEEAFPSGASVPQRQTLLRYVYQFCKCNKRAEQTSEHFEVRTQCINSCIYTAACKAFSHPRMRRGRR